MTSVIRPNSIVKNKIMSDHHGAVQPAARQRRKSIEIRRSCSGAIIPYASKRRKSIEGAPAVVAPPTQYINEKNPNSIQETGIQAVLAMKIQETPQRHNPSTTNTAQKAEQMYRAKCQKATTASGEQYQWIERPGFHETRKVIGKSFAGTDQVRGEPVCEWALDHVGLFEDDKQECIDAISFTMGFLVYNRMKEERAFVISKRELRSGDVVSAAVVQEYNPTKQRRMRAKLLGAWRTSKASFVMATKKGEKRPQLLFNRRHKAEADHCHRKVAHHEMCMQKWHDEEGPKEVHWYVNAVGVSPEFNGRGLGRDLMQKIGELADEAGVICYLGCGVSKRGFYETMGYRVLSTKRVDDPVDGKRDPVHVCTMLRDPTIVK